MHRVYVGIVTYNSLDVLPTCLMSLEAQTFPNIKIIILDNASQDGTIKWILDYHNVPLALLKSPINIGFAKAHNQIMDYIQFETGDFYFALNPDVKLTETYVAELVTGLNLAGAGWGTGKLLHATDDTKFDHIYSVGHGIQADGYVFNIGYGKADTGEWSGSREIWGAPATAVIISADLIFALQDIDCIYEDTFFMYNEDTDFDWKARNLDWECYYIATAIAYHRGGVPTEKLKIDSIGNRYLSAIKNAPLEDLLFYILPVMLLHIIIRCIMTPKRGFQLLGYMFKHMPLMIQKRQLLSPSRSIFIEWVDWSKSEDTAQPRTMHERLSVFINQGLNRRM